MSKETKNLTKSEENLMDIFWTENKPLTSVEILDIAVDRTWQGSYIHLLLRSLMKKGMIEVCGTVQYGSQYARQFKSAITREKYMAKFVTSKGFGNKSLAKIMVAMAKEANYNDELIKQLEKIVNEFKETKT